VKKMINMSFLSSHDRAKLRRPMRRDDVCHGRGNPPIDAAAQAAAACSERIRRS
jgi:hypothetical protein